MAECAARLGKNWDEGLHNGLASFETRPLGAPQDEDKALMALRKFLILRRPLSGCLEGRTAPIQPTMDFLPSLEAHSATSVSAARPSQVALRCRRSIRPDSVPWPRIDETPNAVEVRVVQVSRKVSIIADRVLPAPPLPNDAFATAGHGR